MDGRALKTAAAVKDSNVLRCQSDCLIQIRRVHNLRRAVELAPRVPCGRRMGRRLSVHTAWLLHCSSAPAICSHANYPSLLLAPSQTLPYESRHLIRSGGVYDMWIVPMPFAHRHACHPPARTLTSHPNRTDQRGSAALAEKASS